MTIDERISIAQKRIEQYEHQTILQQNRNKKAASTLDHRRKVLLGEMFIKHFLIALEFTPGQTSDEDAQVFEPLNNFMESLSQCLHSYQLMEDALPLSK